MNLLENMVNVAGIVIERLYFHMNKNLLAFHVVTTKTNENMNSQKYKEKKQILSTD